MTMPQHINTTRITVHESRFFRGELMTCAICGKQEQSDPEVSSNWTVIEWEGLPFYVCPDHFPPPNSSKRAYALAYRKIFTHLAKKQR
jgi:hypothetical protein